MSLQNKSDNNSALYLVFGVGGGWRVEGGGAGGRTYKIISSSSYVLVLRRSGYNLFGEVRQ